VGKGNNIERVLNHYGAPNLCGGYRMTVGDLENSHQWHKCFFQYSTLASERLQFQAWGRQTCFLPEGPLNLVTPQGLSFVWAAKTKALPLWRDWFSGPLWQTCLICALFLCLI